MCRAFCDTLLARLARLLINVSAGLRRFSPLGKVCRAPHPLQPSSRRAFLPHSANVKNLSNLCHHAENGKESCKLRVWQARSGNSASYANSEIGPIK